MPGEETFAPERGEPGVDESGVTRTVQVADFFDSFADGFDNAYEAPTAGGRTLRRRLDAVLALVGSGPGEILDAGMGGGVVSRQLDRRGWTVTGVDISPRMVELARVRLPHLRGRLLQGSILALPFPEARFDAAVATGVLEYVENSLPEAVAELARVLRPGGIAVVSMPNYRSLQLVWRFRLLYPSVRFAKAARRRTPPPPRRAVPFAELESALAAAGLDVRQVELVGVRGVPGALADLLERSRSWSLPLLATQFVVLAGKPIS